MSELVTTIIEETPRLLARPQRIPTSRAIGLAFLSAAMFHVAFEIPLLNCLVLLYAFFLITLSRVDSHRLAFRLGFLAGILVFAPQLAWFWRIFGFASFCLWAVLSFFTGL